MAEEMYPTWKQKKLVAEENKLGDPAPASPRGTNMKEEEKHHRRERERDEDGPPAQVLLRKTGEVWELTPAEEMEVLLLQVIKLRMKECKTLNVP